MYRRLSFAIGAALSLGVHTPAEAQVESTAPAGTSTTDRLLGDIVVTATKKVDPEETQKIPIAITAFNSDTLDAIHFRTIEDISAYVPNAVLGGVGTFKSSAAFSIRGQASLSSIPSVDPAVGIFVDGVYLGINTGVLLETFDIESVQVLRGPQGVLFGRNVAGGAVVVNTSRPSREFRADFMAGAESGLRGTGTKFIAQGVVTGPLGDKVAGKLAVYRSDDGGWFENQFDGRNIGKNETTIVRGALSFNPTETLSFLLRAELGNTDGDGAVGQSHVNQAGIPGVGLDRRTHDISINNVGIERARWNQVTLETNLEVGLGDGRITNIFGWRNLHHESCADIDSTPNSRFHASCLENPIGAAPVPIANGGTRQDQVSDELRYAGKFGAVDLTTGIYYFEQSLIYDEQRSLLGGRVRQSGGGLQHHHVIELLANGDYHLTNDLTLSGGLRFTHEEKDVKIASLTAPKPGATIPGYCVVNEGTCPFDFKDSLSVSNLSHRVAFLYDFSKSVRAFGSWSTAFRSGGYNVRNGSPSDVPGPADPEETSNFELGIKSEPTPTSRLNLTGFYSKSKDLLRSVTRSDPVIGQRQFQVNVGDAEFYGIELDGQMLLARGLLLAGNLGYLHARYTSIRFDLSGDGIIDDKDLRLKIPRTTDLTYSASLIHEARLGRLGTLTSRVTFSHRNDQEHNDNNDGVLEGVDLLDFNLDLAIGDGPFDISVYGKNILNEVVFTSDTQLPPTLGSTFATPNIGKIFGVALRARF